MILYAESSAILAWLLGEPSQDVTLAKLRKATHVVTSSLTVVECARGLARARFEKRISATAEREGLRVLDGAVRGWNIHDISDEVVLRASGPFPEEPVRSLDAIHLATAMLLSERLGPIEVLSFDERIRLNAREVGLALSAEH